ncbi:MAG: plastocyanin/azurin family copper-binding protein [Halobacteriota archaeon]
MKTLEDDETLSRRLFLVGAAGTAAAAGGAAVSTAQEDGGNGTETNNSTDEGGNESDDGGANESDDEGGNESDDGGDGEEEAPPSGATETVEVVDNEFQPADLAIEPNTTVVWEWNGTADHNVNPSDDQPEGANWEGHTELQSEGTYEHTFTVEGTYDYVCDPHVGVGMTGSIEVAEGAGGGAEGPAQLVPDAAWTLLVATLAGMVSTLSLVYFFMRYGGEPAE